MLVLCFIINDKFIITLLNVWLHLIFNTLNNLSLRSINCISFTNSIITLKEDSSSESFLDNLFFTKLTALSLYNFSVNITYFKNPISFLNSYSSTIEYSSIKWVSFYNFFFRQFFLIPYIYVFFVFKSTWRFI